MGQRVEVQQRSCRSVRLEAIWKLYSIVIIVFHSNHSNHHSILIQIFRKGARGKCSTSCFETLLLSACKLHGRKLGSAVKHAPNLPDRLESWCFHFLRPGSKLQLAPSSWHRRPQSPPCKRGLSSGHPTRNWRWFHSYIKGNWSIGIVHIVLHKVLKTDMWIMYIQYRYISYIIYNHI